MKRCPRCEREKPLADFKARKRGGLAPYCTPCDAARKRESSLKNRYGISMVEYDLALAFQGGACAICQNRPRTQRLAVDHNHKTGAIRGLLCAMCNHKLLGGARENPVILRRAAEYLEDPPYPRAIPHRE